MLIITVRKEIIPPSKIWFCIVFIRAHIQNTIAILPITIEYIFKCRSSVIVVIVVVVLIVIVIVRFVSFRSFPYLSSSCFNALIYLSSFGNKYFGAFLWSFLSFIIPCSCSCSLSFFDGWVDVLVCVLGDLCACVLTVRYWCCSVLIALILHRRSSRYTYGIIIQSCFVFCLHYHHSSTVHHPTYRLIISIIYCTCSTDNNRVLREEVGNSEEKNKEQRTKHY